MKLPRHIGPIYVDSYGRLIVMILATIALAYLVSLSLGCAFTKTEKDGSRWSVSFNPPPDLLHDLGLVVGVKYDADGGFKK